MSNLWWQFAFTLTTTLGLLALTAHMIMCKENARIAWFAWQGERRTAGSRLLGAARRYGVVVAVALILAMPTAGPVWVSLVVGAGFLALSMAAVECWSRTHSGYVERVASTLMDSRLADAIWLERAEALQLSHRAMRLRSTRQLLMTATALIAIVLILGKVIDAGASPDDRTAASISALSVGAMVVCGLILLLGDWLDPRAALVERVLAPYRSTRWNKVDRLLQDPWEQAEAARSERQLIRSVVPLVSVHLARKAHAEPGGFGESAQAARATLLRDLVVALDHTTDYERAWFAVLRAVIRPGLPPAGLPEDWSPPGFSRTLDRCRAVVPPAVVVIAAIVTTIVGVVSTLRAFGIAGGG